MPSDRSRATASRITVRLTSYSAHSSASVGSCMPGFSRPERIFADRPSATTVESGLRFVAMSHMIYDIIQISRVLHGDPGGATQATQLRVCERNPDPEPDAQRDPPLGDLRSTR